MCRACLGLRSLPDSGPGRLNDENSRGKVQNVRGGSSAATHTAGRFEASLIVFSEFSSQC